MSVPLSPDQSVFAIGAGGAVALHYEHSSAGLLSTGLVINYLYSHMRHADLGNMGSLSFISARVTEHVNIPVGRQIDLHFSIGAGYFYAVQNDALSSWVTNLTWGGGVGMAYHVTPRMSIDVAGEYRRYESLCHIVGIGLGATLTP